MQPATSPDSLSVIRQIMEKHGASCTANEFHAAVNVAFHEFESEYYDKEHADMWASLPQQFGLLVDDCLEAHPDLRRDLRVLDVGCGTGLASECVMGTALGGRVRSVELLDTSKAMLEQAEKRAQRWQIQVVRHEGVVDSLPAGKQYDLIVTCSVLHHIPDIPGFLSALRRVQAPGGVFLHLQDPNGDYLHDAELRARRESAKERAFTGAVMRFTPKRMVKWLRRTLKGTPGDDYVAKTNRALLAGGWTRSPLTVHELYSIVDIHVENGAGISMRRMRETMLEYECLSQRSYAFFGHLWSTLPRRLQQKEQELIERRAPNGFHIGAAWRRR